MLRSSLSVPVAMVLASACVAVSGAATSSTAMVRLAQDEPEDEAGGWAESFFIEGTALPAVWLTRDTDGGVRDIGDQDGAGYGMRGAVGNGDESVGFLYQGFHVDSIDAYALSFDADARTPLDDGRTHKLFLRASGGVGIAMLDMDGGDTNTNVAQLRLSLDFQPHAGFVISTSFGGIVFGHPGETEAYGTFIGLGGTLVF